MEFCITQPVSVLNFDHLFSENRDAIRIGIYSKTGFILDGYMKHYRERTLIYHRSMMINSYLDNVIF